MRTNQCGCTQDAIIIFIVSLISLEELFCQETRRGKSNNDRWQKNSPNYETSKVTHKHNNHTRCQWRNRSDQQKFSPAIQQVRPHVFCKIQGSSQLSIDIDDYGVLPFSRKRSFTFQAYAGDFNAFVSLKKISLIPYIQNWQSSRIMSCVILSKSKVKEKFHRDEITSVITN